MKIAHISDLHFGREGENLFPAFKAVMEAIRPDLVVVSGDFTQHASRAEFAKAQNFLKSLPCPAFAVPGNHDVSGVNLWERMLYPYRRYRRFIAENLAPVMDFKDAVVAGLNSSRRFVLHWNWANGAVGRSQLLALRAHFKPEDTRWKICVLHHPIHRMADAPISVRLFGAKRALAALREMKVDLVLTGHVHHASITQLGDAEHQTIYLSASTALSTRVRAQGNGFNLITIEPDRMQITLYQHKDGAFAAFENFEQKR